MTEHELFDGVTACIRKTLNRDLPDIKESDRLITDLGADSLDFLDLIFQLERTFALRVNPRDLERRTQAALGSTPVVVDGCYTPEALAEFQKNMPEIPAEELMPGLTTQQFPQTFRVKTFMNLVALMHKEKTAQKG